MRIVTQLGLPVPMRDGTTLVADVYLPDVGHRVPALLLRTPYGRSQALSAAFFDGLRFVKDGYAVVVQDTRGRFDSGGDFYPFRDEGLDGVDSVQWVADADWCNGRVGMIGASYVGATQWLAASRQSPLGAIAPLLTANSFRDGWIYRAGALELGFVLRWVLRLCLDTARRRVASGRASPDLLERVMDACDRVESLYQHLDADATDLLAELAPYYLDWLRQPPDATAWQAIAPDPRPEIAAAAALNVGGWHDIFLGGTLANYSRQRAAAVAAGGASPGLIVGPWSHVVYTGTFPGRRFGARGSVEIADVAGEQIRWFNRWLRDDPGDVDWRPPVRLFVMGDDCWQDFGEWPPSGSVATSIYLHPPVPSTDAASAAGSLGAGPPADGDDDADVLVFDPARPVPTAGGATLLEGSAVGERSGPVDLGAIPRPGVRSYLSPVLDRPMTIVGPVELRLHAWSRDEAAVGFDVVAHLADVAPTGRAELLTTGVLRVPAHAAEQELVVDMAGTAATIAAGHAIRLDLAASDFPRFDLNPGAVAAGGVSISVGRSPSRPSRLILPVLRGA